MLQHSKVWVLLVGLLSKIFGSRAPREAIRKSRASMRPNALERYFYGDFYDGASTTDATKEQFDGACPGSANAHANPEVRSLIKDRARFEVANSSYLRGMARTSANDVIGTRPRLQITDNRLEPEEARAAEKVINQWIRDIGLGKKLRVQWNAKRHDGEGIGVMYEVDPNSPSGRMFRNPIKWDYRLFDCDRLSDITGEYSTDKDYEDGVRKDAYGNPIEYRLLRSNPHDLSTFAENAIEASIVPANRMFHLFSQDRPEQDRGVSEIQSGIVDSRTIRQYVRSVTKAMRNAASAGGILYTGLDPVLEQAYDEKGNPIFDANGEPVKDQQRCTPGETFNLDPDTITCAPDGYELKQMDSKQPGTNHKDFMECVIGSIGRATCLPKNKALGTSEGSNFASGQLDHQDWKHCIDVDRFDLETEVLDPVLDIVFPAAVRIEGLLPQAVRDLVGPDDHPQTPEHVWHWDESRGALDPRKAANAITENFRNGTDNLAAAVSRQGKVLSQHLQEGADALGMNVEDYQKCIRGYLWPDRQPSA